MRSSILVLTLLLCTALFANGRYVAVFQGTDLLKESLPLFQIGKSLPKDIVVPDSLYNNITFPFSAIYNITISDFKFQPNSNGSVYFNSAQNTTYLTNTVEFQAYFTFDYNISNIWGNGSGILHSDSFDFSYFTEFWNGTEIIAPSSNLTVVVDYLKIDTPNQTLQEEVASLFQARISEVNSIIFSYFDDEAWNYYWKQFESYNEVLNYTWDNLNMAFNTSLSFGDYQSDGVLTYIDGEIIGVPGNNPLFPSFSQSNGSFQVGIHYNAIYDFIQYVNQAEFIDNNFTSENFPIHSFHYQIHDFMNIIPAIASKYDPTSNITFICQTDKTCGRAPFLQFDESKNQIRLSFFDYCNASVDDTVAFELTVQPNFYFGLSFDHDGKVIVTVQSVSLWQETEITNATLTSSQQKTLDGFVSEGLANYLASEVPGSRLISFSNVNPRAVIQSPLIYLQDMIPKDADEKEQVALWL